MPCKLMQISGGLEDNMSLLFSLSKFKVYRGKDNLWMGLVGINSCLMRTKTNQN